MSRTTLTGTAVAAFVLGLASGAAVANPDMVAKVKKAGYPAQNCQYCHVSALPKKETFKPEDLNDRGQWLAAEKAKQNASAVNLDWLANYPGGKEQKKK
jgi:hypothetical protein